MDENKFYKYIDDKSILVITPQNKLVRIRCPFAVKDVHEKIYVIDAVIQKANTIYYKSGRNFYLYNCFTFVTSS